MSEEKDFLDYQGNKIPKVLRLAWTVFIAFGVYYVVANLLPNLKEWLQR